MYWSDQDKLSSEAQDALIDISDWFVKKTLKKLTSRCRARNRNKVTLADIRHLIKEFALLPDEVVNNERKFYMSICDLLSFEEKELLLDCSFESSKSKKNPWGFKK